MCSKWWVEAWGVHRLTPCGISATRRNNCLYILNRVLQKKMLQVFTWSGSVWSSSCILSSTVMCSAEEHLPYAVNLNVFSLSFLYRKVSGPVMLQNSHSRLGNYSVTCSTTLWLFRYYTDLNTGCLVKGCPGANQVSYSLF